MCLLVIDGGSRIDSAGPEINSHHSILACPCGWGIAADHHAAAATCSSVVTLWPSLVAISLHSGDSNASIPNCSYSSRMGSSSAVVWDSWDTRSADATEILQSKVDTISLVQEYCKHKWREDNYLGVLITMVAITMDQRLINCHHYMPVCVAIVRNVLGQVVNSPISPDDAI